MKLVRLKLRGSSQFWNMPPIRLYEKQEISPLINIDLLNDDQRSVINKSIKSHDILLLDAEGKRINGNLNDVHIVSKVNISTADIEEDLNLIPQLVSVTVDNEPDMNDEEDEYEEEKEDDGWTIPEKHFEEARILLKINGNTVKKTILALEKTNDNLMLLHACLKEESEGKNRNSVIMAIQTKISEH